MATITEDYCSKDLYRLLIRKGFDGEIHTNFDEEGYTQPCITHQTAIKWLRIEHNIHVVPKFDFYAGDYTGRIYDGRRETTEEKDDYIAIIGNRTYEEAAKISIRYCLENLI